jgi:hypothetical protein
MTLIGLAVAVHVVAAAQPGFDLPLRADLGEVNLDDEDAIIEDTVAVLRTVVQRKLEQSTTEPAALRDVHAKAHGCVAASFVVDADVPVELRAGLFATPGRYDATVRFSSSELLPTQRDWDASFRGLAIKVRAPLGVSLLPSEDSGKSAVPEQDFLLNNRPTFPLRDVREYHDAMAVRRDPLLGGAFLLTHLHAAVPLLIENKRIDDVTKTTYWSMTPLAIGDHAAKLVARPCVVRRPRLRELGTDLDTDYLRARLKARLASSGACFDLLAQVRDPARATLLPIEDATVLWRERDAQPVRIARLLIAPQDFDTPGADARCEALTFNPWHALREHRPLGSLNRARLPVYRALTAFRLENASR